MNNYAKNKSRHKEWHTQYDAVFKAKIEHRKSLARGRALIAKAKRKQQKYVVANRIRYLKRKVPDDAYYKIKNSVLDDIIRNPKKLLSEI